MHLMCSRQGCTCGLLDLGGGQEGVRWEGGGKRGVNGGGGGVRRGSGFGSYTCHHLMTHSSSNCWWFGRCCTARIHNTHCMLSALPVHRLLTPMLAPSLDNLQLLLSSRTLPY